jgi:hypothetical protein
VRSIGYLPNGLNPVKDFQHATDRAETVYRVVPTLPYAAHRTRKYLLCVPVLRFLFGPFSAILPAVFTRRRRITVLVAAVLLLGAVIAVNLYPDEPRYGGRSLGAWLRRYRMPSFPGAEERKETDQAIRHIGTNAIPYLLEYIQYEPPVWRTRTAVDVNELHRRLGRSWRWRDRRVERAEGAAVAFQVLGADAEGAVGELARLMRQTNSRATQYRAVYALPFLGAKSIPPLLAVLTSQQTDVRPLVIGSLRPLGTNARPLVPALIQCLKGRDWLVSESAAQVLADLKMEPASVVPALIESLQDPRPSVRVSSAQALPEFGPDARPALPALTNLLNDPNPTMRQAAANAISRLTAAR